MVGDFYTPFHKDVEHTLENADRAKGERLRDILGSHRGECPVTLELVEPGSFAVAVAPSTYFRVRPDAAFRDEVEALLGPGSLVLARRNGDAG